MLRMMWKKATEVAINGKIPLVVYRSNRSKLCVTIANVPGPMVRGHISFGIFFLTHRFCNFHNFFFKLYSNRNQHRWWPSTYTWTFGFHGQQKLSLQRYSWRYCESMSCLWYECLDGSGSYLIYIDDSWQCGFSQSFTSVLGPLIITTINGLLMMDIRTVSHKKGGVHKESPQDRQRRWLGMLSIF